MVIQWIHEVLESDQINPQQLNSLHYQDPREACCKQQGQPVKGVQNNV